MINISYQEEFRSSNWVTLIYPDSAEKNWLERLRMQHIPFALSPLHDKDVYIDDIESVVDPDHFFKNDNGLKKAHYHLLIKFDTLKSLSQVKCILSECLGENGVVQPFVCHSCRQMVRYFAHLDDPQKYPYDFSQIQTYGLPLKDFLNYTPSEAKALFRNLMSWVNANQISEFDDVWNYAETYQSDWCDILSDHSVFVQNLHYRLASIRGKKKATLENDLYDNGSKGFLPVKKDKNEGG